MAVHGAHERVERVRPAAAAGATQELIEAAYAGAWAPGELDWRRPVTWEDVHVPSMSSIIERDPQLAGLNREERADARRAEMGLHLSALAFGEDRATSLAAQTLLLAPEHATDQRWFLGTLIADEGKHFEVLRRYLDEKLHGYHTHNPALEVVFQALGETHDYDLNLFAGQVVLEGTATALLASLLGGVHEPLLRDLLRRVLRDEGRHMKFAYVVAAPSRHDYPPSRRKRMDEVLFECAYAGAASLLTPSLWDALGLDRGEARRAAVDSLRERGVLRFYTRVVTQQLRRRQFPADELEKLLTRRLEQRLREWP